MTTSRPSMTEEATGNGPSWARDFVRDGGTFVTGVLRFPERVADRNIAYYRGVGGARILDRSHVPFAMTALDTPTLHAFLDAVSPADRDALIVDVGGGDGRNALPWLERGYRRVIVIDAAGEALVRLRSRIAERAPEWLDRVVLVESDARELPLADGCAAVVLAIESLYYLNDDYERGLRECVRILAPQGRLLLAERDREGALVMQLLYHGLEAMLRSHREGAVWDGPAQSVRTRSFTEAELRATLTANGLDVVSVGGTSLLALILGWMNGRGMLDGAESQVEAVRSLLAELGGSGQLRRCHVVIAGHAGALAGAAT